MPAINERELLIIPFISCGLFYFYNHVKVIYLRRLENGKK